MLKKIGMFVVVSTLIAGCSTGPKMQMFSDGRTYYPDWSNMITALPMKVAPTVLKTTNMLTLFTL